jgi:hypothetical protein
MNYYRWRLASKETSSLTTLSILVTWQLATHSWMKMLWHYLHHLNITLDLSSVTNIPSVRQNDRSIINMRYGLGWSGFKLFSVDRFRISNAYTAFHVSLPWTASRYSLTFSLLIQVSAVEYGLMRSPRGRTNEYGMKPSV